MRKSLVVLVSVAALMVAMMLPAGATPPIGVNIEVETSLLGAPSPFVASGPAVDDGLICNSGVVIDDSSMVIGFSQNGFKFHAIKRFTCNDGSGQFFVKFKARIDAGWDTTFSWNVLGGTGNYEDLHGAGSGVGLSICGPECVFDVYDGRLHIN